MIKNFCATFMAFVLLNISVTFAAPNDSFLDQPVFDNTQSLSTTEIKLLTEKIYNIEQKHGVRIGVEFLQSIGNNNIGTGAHALLEQHYGDGRNGGILLLVVMDQRNWYIATDARMDMRVPNVSAIGNSISGNLSGGDFYGACSNYIDAVDKTLTYYEQNGVAYEPAGGFNPIALAVAVALGIMFGVMVRSWLMSSMSNVKPAIAATDYLKRETVKLILNRDTYLFTNVARMPKASGGAHMSNGGGRGGSSGGGGGGSF